MTKLPDFDVALSFAGEDRPYVDKVANILRDKGVRVFYDLFEEANLWGKDLYVYLADVYQNQARYTVMFISQHYAKKLWTNQERRAAQARAFQESQEYILPARFDNTEIPGVLPTTAYLSLRDRSPEQLVSSITRKIVSSGGTVPSDYVRRDFSTIRTSMRRDPTSLIVDVADDEGIPLSNCEVVALAENNTTLRSRTSVIGRASISVQTRRMYRLLVAHTSYPGTVIEKVDPADQVKISLQRTDNVGSLVIHSTGHIPGLEGRLNPILDTRHRKYLYADNIAINGGVPQPATFAVNEPIELEDAEGHLTFATVKFIAGVTTLLQYLRIDKV